MVDTVNCRVLEEKDGEIIPIYLDIVQTGLEGLRGKYSSPKEIADAMRKYSQNYLAQQLTSKGDCRLIGAFRENSLDGVLIEGFRRQDPYNLTRINWMFARTPGAGIGTSLLHDIKSRAEAEGNDIVELLVSEKNPGAKRLYAREGFIETADFPEREGTIPLFYFINPELKEYYGVK